MKRPRLGVEYAYEPRSPDRWLVMRLTLRTLLAWMDGTLEPAQLADLSFRIEVTPSAQSLINRVRKALAAESAPQAVARSTRHGVDPNTVAAYLDNTLSSVAVVGFERVCLDSDQQLAEVAACHQVLKQVSRGPVPVSRRLRERCHALGPKAASLQLTPPSNPSNELAVRSRQDQLAAYSPSSSTGQRRDNLNAEESLAVATLEVEGLAQPSANDSSVNTPVEETSGFPPAPHSSLNATLPEFLQERPASKWPWIVAGGFVLTVWMGLAFRASPLARNWEFPSTKAGPSTAQSPDDSDSRPTDEGRSEQEEVAAVNESGPVLLPGVPTSTDPILNDITSPVTENVVANPAAELDEDVPQRFARKSPVRSGPSSDVPATNNMREEVAQKPSPPVVVSQWMMGDGVIFYREDRSGEWNSLSDNAQILNGSQLVVPAPYEATFRVAQGQFHVWGGARFGWLSEVADSAFACHLDLGQMVLSSSAGAGLEGLSMLVELAGELWRVDLPAGESLGIEVSAVLPTSVAQALTIPNRRVHLSIASGVARLTRLGAESLEITLTGPETLDLPLDPDRLNPGRRQAERETSSVSLPEPPKRVSLNSKSATSQFRKLFAAGGGVEEMLLGVATGADPRQSELATVSLGLLGSIESLVAVLQTTRHGESRLQAILGLRRCLLEAEANRHAIRESLTRRFSPELTQQVERLLWGFTPDDARSVEATGQLLDALGSTEVAVRELAITHLRELVRRDFDFQASGSELQRASALRAWRQLVHRNGGTLLRTQRGHTVNPTQVLEDTSESGKETTDSLDSSADSCADPTQPVNDTQTNFRIKSRLRLDHPLQDVSSYGGRMMLD